MARALGVVAGIFIAIVIIGLIVSFGALLTGLLVFLGAKALVITGAIKAPLTFKVSLAWGFVASVVFNFLRGIFAR